MCLNNSLNILNTTMVANTVCNIKNIPIAQIIHVGMCIIAIVYRVCFLTLR